MPLNGVGYPQPALDGIAGLGLSKGFQPLNLKGKGPLFVDTGACRCALQQGGGLEAAGVSDSTWRCVGNVTQNLYNGTSGKFFQMQQPSSQDIENLNVDDQSLLPDASKAFVFDPDFTQLDSANNNSLSIYDQACTANLDKLQSNRIYNILRVAGQDPSNEQAIATAAAVCENGNVPAVIISAQDWNSQGCPQGFMCPNNTVNSLPQYCIPDASLQAGRLVGLSFRQFGLYEPFVCPQNFYCPAGAKEPIICPAGSFCPLGSMSPIGCTGAASCPEGSSYNQPIVPIILLVLWDVALILIFVFAKWQHKRKQHRTMQVGGMMSYLNKKHMNASGVVTHSPDMGRSRAGSYVGLGQDEYEMESHITSVKAMEGGGYLGAEQEVPDDASLYKPSQYEANDLDAFVASLSRCIQGSSFGLSFVFNNLSFQPKGSNKPILSAISGQIKGGSLVGVMGGSGAGKSTFVNVLMGKYAHTSGETKVNGVAGQIGQYKKIIGYVPQDDILLSELTVRENILHSARIRLPSNWSDKDIQKHVDILLSCLKLDHVRDNIVGSVAKPGVSGGQRKRVSIGMELAAAPMALFLDEPTSGLDATAASSIMELLKALSRLGITIVTIIHQPRQEIFESLDDLILLGLGRMIFEGATPMVEKYFAECGFHFPRNQNPADVIMDIINGEGRHYKRVGDISIASLIEYWSQRQAATPPVPTIIPPRDEVAALKRSIRKRGAPWPKQIYLCLTRAMLQQYRFAQSFWFEMGVATLAGVLIGLAENGEHGDNFRGIYTGPYAILSSSVDVNSIGQMALLVGIAIGLVAASPAVKVFGEEKLMYYREAASGHNRFAYYIGKVISTLPRMALGCVHFTTLFMVLATPRMHWLASLLSNFLYFWCIYGLASVVSMVTRREDGPLLAVMATLIVGTLCGMAPPLKLVTSWHMEWLWRASPGTWLSEFYYISNVTPWEYLYQVQAITDNSVGFNLNNASMDLWVLAVIGAIYRVLAFLAMRFLNRSKQN